MIFVPVANRPPYLPMSSRTPAAIANAPMTWLGIANRVNDASPVRMSQIANSSIPIDTTPIIIGFPPLWFLERPIHIGLRNRIQGRKSRFGPGQPVHGGCVRVIFLFETFMLG